MRAKCLSCGRLGKPRDLYGTRTLSAERVPARSEPSAAPLSASLTRAAPRYGIRWHSAAPLAIGKNVEDVDDASFQPLRRVGAPEARMEGGAAEGSSALRNLLKMSVYMPVGVPNLGIPGDVGFHRNPRAKLVLVTVTYETSGLQASGAQVQISARP